MEQTGITIRNATRDDSPSIADLDRIASGGVLDFLYHDLVPGKTPVELVAEIISHENESYSFAGALVAEIDGEIAGMTISYHSKHHVLSDDITGFFSREKVDQVRVLFTAEVPESLYVDSFAVHAWFRERGIGGALLDRTAGKARSMGFNRMSLITFADNEVAQRLYRKHGFKIVRRLRFRYHEMMPHRGGVYVMVADV